ncbi:hypothetical protein GEMRC1_007582 [Eukaryota sp. GEM-RC1]
MDSAPGSRCQFHHCSVHDFLPTPCPHCNQSFCVNHRPPVNHSCTNFNTVITSNSTSTSSSYIRKDKCHSCKTLVMTSLLVQCPKCHYSYCLEHRHPDQHRCRKPPPPPRKPFLLPGSFNAIVMKRRRKDAAVGKKDIPIAERVYLDVVYQDQCKMFFFTQSTAAGRAVDVIASHFKVRNSAELNLKRVKSRESLVKSSLLGSFNSSVLDVVLE